MWEKSKIEKLYHKWHFYSDAPKIAININWRCNRWTSLQRHYRGKVCVLCTRVCVCVWLESFSRIIGCRVGALQPEFETSVAASTRCFWPLLASDSCPSAPSHTCSPQALFKLQTCFTFREGEESKSGTTKPGPKKELQPHCFLPLLFLLLSPFELPAKFFLVVKCYSIYWKPQRWAGGISVHPCWLLVSWLKLEGSFRWQLCILSKWWLCWIAE